MKRKFLAALLALVMVFSMIPVSASAADYVESSQNGYFTITYDNRVIDRTLTVNMKDVEGNLLDSLTVNNVQAADAAIQIALTPAHKNEYNIACVEIANGTQTLLNVSNDVCSFRTTVSSAATVTVILCKQPNIEGEEIDPGYGTIQYRAYEPALLKLLKSNDIRVDKNTIIEDIAFDFIGEYVDDDYDFSYTPTGANNLAYFHAILSNAGCRATPNNIKSLVITYSQNGNEQSIAIPSEKLRYVSENGIYKIEANDDSIFVVAFYYEAGAELTTWSLYDVRFVDTGTALGSENMPADPTYGDGNTYIFTNWDKNVGGGDPFLPYEEVLDDTVVYAQKTSSPGRGGTEIHVMNTDNELANRIMEIYNAENDTQLGSNSIDMDSVTIYATSKDGKTTTNHNYWNNGWRPLTGGNQYYRVINSDIAGDHPTISNDHIAHNDIGSITITATVNGTSFTVTLPVDETAPGAVSVSSVQDNIIEISVNGAPDTPTDDELTGDTGLLKEGAVKVICTNEEATHKPAEQTYGLLDGYTLSDVQWTGDGETGYYYVDITVPAAGYVTKFSIDSGADHALALDAAATDTIRLQYSNEGWKVMDEETPVTFEVACETEPEDEPPENPTWEDVERIFKDAIKVDCVNSNATHNDGTYDALEGSYTLGTITPSENLYTVELTFSAEKYLSEYNNLYGNHVLTGEQKNVLTLIYRNDIWCYEGGERYPVIFSVTCEDGGEEPDSNFVTQYWVMNDLDVIEKVFSAKEPDKELAGIELGTSTGIATDGETLGNGWNNSEDKLYYIVSNGEPNGDNYVPWKEVSRLTFLYENGSNGITNLDIRVEEPDENGISKVYLLYDVRYNFNNGTTNGWKHTDSTKNWASASTYTVVTPTSPYLTPPNGDGREVELIGWSQTQHNTIFEPNAELPDHLTAGGTFTVDPNAENTNNTSLMINLYAVWTYKDTSTEPTPDPDPTPDPTPTPTPTPTPGPGGGDKPPYIPPVDPDDSGVSDLLNTDDHIQYLFGYPEGTFGPENNMTRAEVAQMFYNLLLDQDVTITKTFDDVPANAWYAKAVNTLASLGVVSGVGNGDFEPERSITRAEFTSIAMKFAEGKTGGTNIFSDVKSTDWFYRAVVNSTQYGWIHGYGDGTFRPNNPITRVEVTAIVNNMLGREADVDFVTEHYDELNHFSDLVVSHWGYYHIVEATNDHDYTKPSSGENWTELN